MAAAAWAQFTAPWQPSLQRWVAVKVLDAGGSTSPQRIERFRTEALATARIDDPRIVKVHAVGEAHDVFYLAMELVDGQSLHAYLADPAQRTNHTALPPPTSAANCRQIAALFAEIAAALDVAHGQGVLHRDIQPKNILIDRQSRPRLIDFGLARIVDQPGLTRTGEVIGTPCYMSPGAGARAAHRDRSPH